MPVGFKVQAMAIAFAALSVAGPAEGQNINAPDRFPDPAFRRAVESYLGVDRNQPVPAGLAASATARFKLPGHDVEDLTGIEWLASLRELDCSNNKIARLDLSGNPELRALDCSNNQLTELDLRGNPSLRELSCQDNRLSSIDLSGNALLTYLECDNNQLSSLNLSGNPLLRYIDCNSNAIGALKAAGMADLEKLYCFHNRLTSLDLTGCVSLRDLVCNNNFIGELILPDPASLVLVECHTNQLASLDVSNRSAVRELVCFGNAIGTLNLAGAVSLEFLKCGDNRLAELDLRDAGHLTAVLCENNQIERVIFPIAPAKFIGILNISNNRLDDLGPLVASETLGIGLRSMVDVRRNELDCGDWPDVAALLERAGEAEPIPWNPGEIRSGFAYSPQNGLDPFECGTAVPVWRIHEPLIGEAGPAG